MGGGPADIHARREIGIRSGDAEIRGEGENRGIIWGKPNKKKLEANAKRPTTLLMQISIQQPQRPGVGGFPHIPAF